MTSALAMVLAAAMAVPRSGPERASGEFVELLDMRGEWKGTMEAAPWGISGSARMIDGLIRSEQKKGDAFGCEIIDEGSGRLRMHLAGAPLVGIYRWDRDRLFICVCSASEGVPTSFHADRYHYLLILRRIQPPK